MSDEEFRLLDSLGVTWKSRDVGTWEDRYRDLVEFKSRHGHCAVPFTYKDTPKLGPFVNSMRTKKTNGELSHHRIDLLESIGFQWAVRDTANVEAWENRFAELQMFKSRHGHCKVPSEWEENPQLGRWVSFQRQKRQGGKLDLERQHRLEEIGFDWFVDRHEDQWHVRIEQLTAYKQSYGNYRVPVKWADNPQLGEWVRNLRRRRKAGDISSEKEAQLREIGFDY